MKDYTLEYCYKCNTDRLLDQDGGYYVCQVYGEVGGYKNQESFIPQIWRKQRSEHKRNKWFAKVLRRYVNQRDVSILFNDFMKVVVELKKNKLIKKNISRYDYYIIRLATRRGIKLLKSSNHLKENSNIRVKFDDLLFGIVYRELGWDKNCNCPYYLIWENKRN